jgi:acetyltransferase-like isoleucine patch superfamily enzyme
MKLWQRTSLILFFPFIDIIYYVIEVYNKIIPFLYWVHFKRRFMKIGKNSFIEYPFIIKGAEYMQIGENFAGYSRLRLEAIDKHQSFSYEPTIVIGDHVIINYDCHIGCINKIVIGNGVLLASRVFITDHFHGKIDTEALKIRPASREIYSKGPVIIEDNVWIGEGVAIMPNVRIGQNSIIGANSVVTRDIPENSVAVGNPARIIKTLT